jgi:hypothetical protein
VYLRLGDLSRCLVISPLPSSTLVSTPGPRIASPGPARASDRGRIRLRHGQLRQPPRPLYPAPRDITRIRVHTQQPHIEGRKVLKQPHGEVEGTNGAAGTAIGDFGDGPLSAP